MVSICANPKERVLANALRFSLADVLEVTRAGFYVRYGKEPFSLAPRYSSALTGLSSVITTHCYWWGVYKSPRLRHVRSTK